MLIWGVGGVTVQPMTPPFLPPSSLGGSRKALNWDLGDWGSSLCHQQAGGGVASGPSLPLGGSLPLRSGRLAHSGERKWTFVSK